MIDPITQENMALLRERREVRERRISYSITRASEDDRGAGFRFAIVGECDRLNQNHRVYPRAEWEKQIDRASRELIPNGVLIGAVDHADPSTGGNLKGSPIIWRRLELLDGQLVGGHFDVIESHSAGRDLLAQINAGMAIGFSTVGYARAHEPSEEERQRYHIPADDTRAVIIQDFELVRVDAVDNPSVRAARLRREGHGALPDPFADACEPERPVTDPFADDREPEPPVTDVFEVEWDKT